MISYSNGSNSCILKLKKHVYKLPLTLLARKSLLIEHRGYQSAQSNPFWSQFSCKQQLVANLFLKTPHLQKLDGHPLHDILLSSVKEHVKKSSAEQTICSMLCNKVVELHLSKYPSLQSEVNKIVPAASCHGDLYIDNILIQRQSPVLIDWRNYRNTYWHQFDLKHYTVMKACATLKMKWFDFILSNSCDLEPHDKWHYSLFRANLEIEDDETQQRFSLYKKKKYNLIFNWLNKNIPK